MTRLSEIRRSAEARNADLAHELGYARRKARKLALGIPGAFVAPRRPEWIRRFKRWMARAERVELERRLRAELAE